MKAVTRGISILAIILGVLVLVPLLLVALVPKERVRQIVVSRLEAGLHQPVQIGKVDYRFLPSFQLRLEDVAVGSRAEPNKPRYGAESLRLGMRLLPLLKKRVVITGIEIDRPLVESMLSAAPPAPPAVRPAPAPTGLDLQVERLAIRDGRIAVLLPDRSPLLELAGFEEDLSAHLSERGAIALDGVTVVDTIRFHMVAGTFGEGLRVRLQKKLGYDLSSDVLNLEQATLDLSGVPVDVKGKVTGISGEEPQLDLVLQGGPGEIRDIIGLLPAQLFPQVQGAQSSGTLRLAGTVRGPSKKVDFRVSLSLENGRLQAPSLPQPIEGVRLLLRADPDSVIIDEFAARSGASSLRAHATLTQYQVAPRFLVAADADLDLGAVSGFYAAKNSLQLGGRVAVQVIAEGRADQPAALALDGTARLSNVSVSGPDLVLPVKDAAGELVFSRQNVTLRNASARMGGSDFAASGSVQNLPALQDSSGRAGRARMELQLRSRQILFDEMFPTPSKGKLALPPLPPLDGVVVIHIGRFQGRGLDITNASGRMTLDHGVIRLDQATLGVYGGQVGLQGLLDATRPTSPRYDLAVDARSLDVRELFSNASVLERYGHLAGSLSGKLNARADLKGTMTDSLLPDPRTLTAAGNLEIAQAQLAGHPLQKAVAGYLDAPSLQTLQIAEWKEGFQIEQGKLYIRGLSMKAGPTELMANGWQALDGEIEMGLDLLVPPALASGLRAKLPAEAAAVVFAGGDRIFVPLRLTGRVNSPNVGVDTAQLTAAARQAAEAKLREEKAKLEQQAKEHAGQILQGVLKGGADTTGATPTKKDVEDEVKKRLKGLFGK